MEKRKIESTDDGYLLSAIQDAPDLRDLPFEPTLVKLEKRINPPSGLAILDQKFESACSRE